MNVLFELLVGFGVVCVVFVFLVGVLMICCVKLFFVECICDMKVFSCLVLFVNVCVVVSISDVLVSVVLS